MKLRPGNAQHQGSRDAQQDSFGFSDLENRAFTTHAGFLGAVADGMGGLERGGAAATTAIKSLLDSYATKQPDESIPAALLRSVRSANEAVVALAPQGTIELGTTLVAAVVDGGYLHWISVGDSRAYLWRAGAISQLTVDHHYGTALLAEASAGMISFEQASSDPDRGALTSHLGLQTLPAIDRSRRPMPLFAGDRIVLCSDGLYRALMDGEIASGLGHCPQDDCEGLVARVLDKQYARQDNVTILVIGLDDDDVTSGVTVDKGQRAMGMPR